jgi:hypothetical protein
LHVTHIRSVFCVRQNLYNAILSYESSIQLNFKQNGGPSALTENKPASDKKFCFASVNRTLLFQSQPADGFRGTTLQNKCDLQNFGGNEAHWVPEKLCEKWSNVAGRQGYSGFPLTDIPKTNVWGC